MSKSLATTLSYVFHPALFPLLGVFLVLKISPQYYPAQVVMMSLALVFCGTYVIPVAISVLLFRLRIVDSLHMRQARERRLPYAFGAISFYFTAVLAGKVGIMHEAYLFLLAASALIVIHLILLLWLKPSAHMAGIGAFLGLLIALSLRYSINLLPLIVLAVLAAGFLASARLRLDAHTPLEILLGLISGAGIVGGTLALA